MQVCKCGEENENTTIWCKKCGRKLYVYVDKSKQTTLRIYYDNTSNTEDTK